MEAVFLKLGADRVENLKSGFSPKYYGLHSGLPGSGITVNRRWVVVF